MTSVASVAPSAPARVDLDTLDQLNLRFAATVKATVQTRRERLRIIIEGYHLFQALEGPCSDGSHAVYDARGITGSMSDVQKAAQAITGEVCANETDKTARNRMYNRIRTVAGILSKVEDDFKSGAIPDGSTADEIIEIIENEGGWRAYGEAGLATIPKLETGDDDGDDGDDGDANDPSGDTSQGGNVAAAQTGISKVVRKGTGTSGGKKPPVNDLFPFDTADLRARITNTGLDAMPSKPIPFPEPQVAFVCGDDMKLRFQPLDGLPIALLRSLLDYLPSADEQVVNGIKDWGLVTTALQLFDRQNSSIPLNPDVEPYVDQDAKPSLPAIDFLSAKQVSISSGRVNVAMVVEVELNDREFLPNWKEPLPWVHGRGTNSLVDNLSSVTHRASYLQPAVGKSGNGKGLKFAVPKGSISERQAFSVELKQRDTMPHDYWMLEVERFTAKATASIDGVADANELLMQFARDAGAAKNVKKPVKLGIGKAFTLGIGSSKANPVDAEVTGSEKAEVRSPDLARALTFARTVGARSLCFEIDPEGLLALRMTVPDQARVSVFIPFVSNGVLDRKLLKQVRS